MRIFQVFINVDGLRIRGQPFLGVIPRPSQRRFGFYAVLFLVADQDSEASSLLGLARNAVAAEFDSVSLSRPDTWSVQMVDWRIAGMAPPLFNRPGCIDRKWGAAWYESTDERAKQHRYRLVKTRLWKGRRARMPRTGVS